MAIYEIPLSAKPQILTININGTYYELTVKWNPVSACWVLDIADTSGNAIVSGIAIVTGCNLVEQYAYLGLNFTLFAQTDGSVYTPPTYDSLGSTGHLYFEV